MVRAAILAAVLCLVSLGCSSGPAQTSNPTSATPATPSLTAADTPAASGSPAVSVSPSASVALSTPAGPSASPSPSFLVYAVVRGDSLLSIAARYRTTGRSIAYWNRDTYPSLDPDSPGYSPNRIEIGWKLRLIPDVTLDEGALPSRRPTLEIGRAHV